MFIAIIKLQKRLFYSYLFFLFLLRFQGIAAVADYSIVLVHIGPRLPVYISDTIYQIRLFNPDCPLYLLINEQAVPQTNSFAQKYSITLQTLETLPLTQEHINFQKNADLNPYHTGFILYTKERFLYLYDLVHYYNLHSVFHLENDNLLYVNLKELMPTFLEYRSMGITFTNDEQAIGGFMYIAHPKALQGLAHFFAEHARNPEKNDMLLLADYAMYSSNDVRALPIIMDEYVENHVLESVQGQKSSRPYLYTHNCALFNSLFDTTYHGVYLGGTDPAYKTTGPGFIDEYCVINASRLTYCWELDECGRKIPYVQYSNKKYRLNNLHIHSKKLSEFRS